MGELIPATQGKRFWGWIVGYAVLIWIATGKGGHNGDDVEVLIWGMILGVGAALAICNLRVDGVVKRLAVLIAWGLLSIGAAFLLIGGGAFGPERSWESSAISTAIFGFPALLALIPWLFKKSKAPSEG